MQVILQWSRFACEANIVTIISIWRFYIIEKQQGTVDYQRFFYNFITPFAFKIVSQQIISKLYSVYQNYFLTIFQVPFPAYH